MSRTTTTTASGFAEPMRTVCTCCLLHVLCCSSWLEAIDHLHMTFEESTHLVPYLAELLVEVRCFARLRTTILLAIPHDFFSLKLLVFCFELHFFSCFKSGIYFQFKIVLCPQGALLEALSYITFSALIHARSAASTSPR